jgi:hypothetical protein
VFQMIPKIQVALWVSVYSNIIGRGISREVEWQDISGSDKRGISWHSRIATVVNIKPNWASKEKQACLKARSSRRRGGTCEITCQQVLPWAWYLEEIWTSEGRKIKFENSLERAANWTKLAPNRVLADNIRLNLFFPFLFSSSGKLYGLLNFQLYKLDLAEAHFDKHYAALHFRLFSRSCDSETRLLVVVQLPLAPLFANNLLFLGRCAGEKTAKPFIFPFMWQITRSINS